jgi:diguanylate cyclase (GGDEF)-like protein/PAS domain S-box-containing protein
MVIVLVFGLIALVLLGAIYLQGSVLDGVRAYVRGEGQWAKAQKDAVLALDRYASSHDEADYRTFRQALQVNLGDREARLALSQNPPDLAAAREGLLRGRNQADDIDSLVWLYRNFQFVSFLGDAIGIWALGDRKIDELAAIGEEIHSEAHDGGGRAEEMARLRDRLDRLNAEFMKLEDRFSGTLGDGARWVRRTFWFASVALSLALLALATLVSRQILRRIARSEEQLRLAGTVFASSRDGVLITAPDLAIITANQAMCDMMGWSAAELEGRTPRIFRSGHTTTEQYREMWAGLNERGNWQGEIVDRTKEGALLPVRVSINGVKDVRGRLTHYVAIVTDISERKAQEDRLRHLAHHDALTGLPNRVLFDDRIEQAVKNARRYGTRFAVLFLDLDAFKPVNDRFGHEVGDKLLKLVARRLTASVRGTDTVTRRGGDEFAILLVDVEGRDEAEGVLGKIIAAVRAPYQIGEHTIEIGVSVGMGMFPDDGADPEVLMHHADVAMYGMKYGDRGRPSAS